MKHLIEPLDFTTFTSSKKNLFFSSSVKSSFTTFNSFIFLSFVFKYGVIISKYKSFVNSFIHIL